MNLPDGVILEILNSAEHLDIKSLCQVNKQFRQMCSDPRTYKRILELRDIVRARKVEKLLQLKNTTNLFWHGFNKILPPSAEREYHNLLWEQIIKFVERHPELTNQFDTFFFISDYSNPTKALNDWLAQTMWVNSEHWAELILQHIDRVTEYKKKQELSNLINEALRQLFLTNPDYTTLMYQYITNYKQPVKGDINFPGWKVVAPRM